MTDFLVTLAETPPRQYLQRRPSGQSVLRELYQQAAEAQLVPASAGDDVAILHALFDVALQHGVGGLVCDYVAEVCGDRMLTSSDPVEAFLLDSECVRRWVQKSVAVSKGRFSSWLERGLVHLGSGLLLRELGRLQVLQLVARALAEASGNGEGGGSGGPEVAEVEGLAQVARVLGWLTALQEHGGGGGLGFSRPTGCYPSEQEWRSAVAKRRDGAAPHQLFLIDLLGALAKQGVESLPYPPSAPERLVAALFLAGCTNPPALEAKLAMLAYALADGGYVQPTAIAAGLQSCFDVPSETSHAWLLQQQLDACFAQPAGAQRIAAVQQAAALVAGVDGSAVHFKLLQSLLLAGRSDLALLLLKQRTGSLQSAGQHDSKEEAQYALAVRLANGLLGEAVLESKRHLGSVPLAEREEHAHVLVAQLLGWSLPSRTLHAVIRLPFDDGEEKVALEWLQQSARSAQQAALMLVLYLLMRGRTPDALQAYAQYLPSQAASDQQAQLGELLQSASRMLPAVQQASLAKDSGGQLAALEGPADAAGRTGLMGSIFALLARQLEEQQLDELNATLHTEEEAVGQPVLFRQPAQSSFAVGGATGVPSFGMLAGAPAASGGGFSHPLDHLLGTPVTPARRRK